MPFFDLLAILIFPDILGLILTSIPDISMWLTVLPASLENTVVIEIMVTLSLHLPILKTAYVLGTILVFKFSLAIEFILLPVTIVDTAVRVGESSLSMDHSILQLALIHSTIFES